MVLAHQHKRRSALAASLLLVLASIIPMLSTSRVAAYGLIQSRKITMESSANGSIAAGQGVDYQVSFNVATDTSNIAGVVVDFCSNSPIIGEACTAPTGMSVSAATLSLGSGLTGFTKDSGETTANKFVLTGSAYNPGVSENLVFTLQGVDNPETTNSTFYARIVTFTTAVGAQDYDSGTVNANNPGAEPPVIDAGGIALSTTEQITITSKVQEKLTFCVYTSAANYTDCTGVTGNAVTLGDTNGVLDTAGPYVDKTTKYNIATNASVDAIIRVKGDTLTTGSFDITEIGGSSAVSSAGSEQFGLCTYTDSGSTDTLTLDPDSPYAHANCSATTQSAGTGTTGGTGGAQFAFDTTQTMSTYGENIATKTAGDFSTGVIAFLGNIANTTEAGIYSTTLTFIATGTY